MAAEESSSVDAVCCHLCHVSPCALLPIPKQLAAPRPGTLTVLRNFHGERSECSHPPISETQSLESSPVWNSSLALRILAHPTYPLLGWETLIQQGGGVQ